MTDRNIAITFTVDQTPEEAFAVIQDVSAWWTGGKIEGRGAQPGDEFTYRFGDLHFSKQRVTEAAPGRRLVWSVLDSNLSFLENKTEWTGTSVTFDLARKDGKTEVRFTHVGLSPECACYEACSKGWSFYVNQSLRPLIAGGRQANPDGRPRAGRSAARTEG